MAKKTSGSPAESKKSKSANGNGQTKGEKRTRPASGVAAEGDTGSPERAGFASGGVTTRDGAPDPKHAPVAPSNGQAAPDAAHATGVDEGGPISLEDLRKVKTGLGKKDLEGYRKLLLEKRGEILGDVASLQTDTRNNGGNLSNMPLHMADVGSDNFEQEFRLGLVESERRLLEEIDSALLRINHGVYGVCLQRGEPISRARLDAKPWAKYCIEAEREMEKRHR